MATTIFILIIGAVLIIGALLLFSSTKEHDTHPKPDDKKGVILEPKLTEEDLKAFSRQHKLVSNPFSLITSIVIIGLIVVAFPFIKNTFFKGKSLFPTTNRMMTHGMSREQFQEICVETLMPTMEEALVNTLGRAFMGDPDAGDEMEQRLQGLADQFGLPSIEAAMALCAEADTRFNPNPEDRMFKQSSGQAHHPEPLIQSTP